MGPLESQLRALVPSLVLVAMAGRTATPPRDQEGPEEYK